MRRLLLLFAVVLFTGTAFAQRNCGTMDVLQQMQKEDPFLEERMDQIEEFTRNYIQRNTEAVSGVVTIPVVFHVVYNKRKSSENISTAQINSQMTVLNDDFRRLNSDANNTWSQADDIEIEFCLASIDPSGNATTGITRKKTSKNSFGTNNSVKYASQGGTDAWPASSYLNIWICNIGGGILGYAQFPGGNAATDGVVLDYRYVGTTGTATYPFNLGRTATHEVGHWLNLRHIWGDGGCSFDDYVSDTPLSDAANYYCATGHVSCGSVDMVENYMDYSDDACMNLFTTGQKSRMRALFGAGGARASLLSSNGCGGTPPAGTCSDGIQNQNETGIDCGGVCPACPTQAQCTDPTGLSSTPNKGGREALLSWNSVSSASQYNLGLRAAGSSTWVTTTTTGTSVTATNLTKGNTYEWYVQADCGNNVTSNQVTATFVAGQSARLAPIHDLELYPNPTADFVSLRFFAETAGGLTIGISDVSGRLVNSTHYQVETGNNVQVIDMKQLTPGIYIISVSLNGETTIMKISKQ